jgi:transcription antitermination factor NusG
MLNEALLLDSTRPVSNQNILLGCPEHGSQGVPLSWYVLRVTYSRELKIKAILDEKGVRTFVPMMWRKRTAENGKSEKKLVPAVGNLCFVYWTRSEIDEFIRGYGDNSPVHYYWDRTLQKPMTVPDKEMNDFITVASSMDEDLIYITEISDKLREGQSVKVKRGPFAGVTGKVVRIRKSRRIMVELPGMLAVASTYVRPENVELITID